MNNTQEDKLKKAREKFARLAQGETATVTVHTEHGDEVHHVRKNADGELVWEKVKPAKPNDAA